MKKITDRQLEVLTFLKEYRVQEGYPPTRRDITDKFQFRSPNAAEEHLRALARKGYIKLIPNTSRGIIMGDTQSPDHLPVIGRVAAGSPILAVEHIERQIDIPSTLFAPKADYLLRVQGDSMIEAGILDDDLLAVHRTKDVHDGQIVVVRVEDEVTVKQLKRGTSDREIILIPANKDYKSMVIDLGEHEVEIEGISVGVLRLGV